jgi:predicted ATPase
VIVEYPKHMPLRYQIGFIPVEQTFVIEEEAIEDSKQYIEGNNLDFYYRQEAGYAVFKTKQGINRREEFSNLSNYSILSLIKDPLYYPEITYLGNQFSNISLYRDWHVGRNSKARLPQQTDLPEHPLLEDGSNLGIFWNNLQHKLGNRKIIEKLNKFYDTAEELITKIYGGTVQIFIRETGLTQPIPATRLSDSTLHYLFLMALLLDPTPPPLLCIEEPVEKINKSDLESALKRATKDTSKGEYHKIIHGAKLLEQVDVAKVRSASPHCDRFGSVLHLLKCE